MKDYPSDSDALIFNVQYGKGSDFYKALSLKRLPASGSSSYVWTNGKVNVPGFGEFQLVRNQPGKVFFPKYVNNGLYNTGNLTKQSTGIPSTAKAVQSLVPGFFLNKGQPVSAGSSIKNASAIAGIDRSIGGVNNNSQAVHVKSRLDNKGLTLAVKGKQAFGKREIKLSVDEMEAYREMSPKEKEVFVREKFRDSSSKGLTVEKPVFEATVAELDTAVIPAGERMDPLQLELFNKALENGDLHFLRKMMMHNKVFRQHFSQMTGMTEITDPSKISRYLEEWNRFRMYKSGEIGFNDALMQNTGVSGKLLTKSSGQSTGSGIQYPNGGSGGSGPFNPFGGGPSMTGDSPKSLVLYDYPGFRKTDLEKTLYDKFSGKSIPDFLLTADGKFDPIKYGNMTIRDFGHENPEVVLRAVRKSGAVVESDKLIPIGNLPEGNASIKSFVYPAENGTTGRVYIVQYGDNAAEAERIWKGFKTLPDADKLNNPIVRVIRNPHISTGSTRGYTGVMVDPESGRKVNQITLIRHYYDGNRGLKRFTLSEMQETLHHEGGHRIFDRLFGNGNRMTPQAGQAVDEFKQIIDGIREKPDIVKKYYTTGTDIREMFAETVKYYYNNKRDLTEIDQRLIPLFEKIIKMR